MPTGGRGEIGPGEIETVGGDVRGCDRSGFGAGDNGTGQRVAQTVCGKGVVWTCGIRGGNNGAGPCTCDKEPVIVGAVSQIGGKGA